MHLNITLLHNRQVYIKTCKNKRDMHETHIDIGIIQEIIIKDLGMQNKLS